MKSCFVVLVTLAAASCGAAIAPPSADAKVRNKVKGEIVAGPTTVVDGDTLEIASKRFRLWGIDAPNRGIECTRKGQGWKPAQEAGKALISCIKGQTVTCRIQKREYSRRRFIAECWNEAGEDLGACMVRAGWAIDFTGYSGGYYLPLENEPKAKGAGIWQCEGGPRPPLVKRWCSKGEGLPCEKRIYKPQGPTKP